MLLVGPSGAGKTTRAKRQYGADEIVSSDAIREEIYGSLSVAGSQAEVFAEVHKCVRERLSRGETAVVDATNLRQRDRLAVVDLAPADILVIYEVVDRPIEEKLAQAGRRTAELIQGHAEMFDLELANIMKGDGRPNVVVCDLRQTTQQESVAAK